LKNGYFVLQRKGDVIDTYARKLKVFLTHLHHFPPKSTIKHPIFPLSKTSNPLNKGTLSLKVIM